MTTLKELLAAKCGGENQIWVTHVTGTVKEWLQQKRQKYLETEDIMPSGEAEWLIDELLSELDYYKEGQL